MTTKCKKKGCINEALNGEKYCKHHQAEREDVKRAFIKGAGALGAIALAIVSKKQIKK